MYFLYYSITSASCIWLWFKTSQANRRLCTQVCGLLIKCLHILNYIMVIVFLNQNSYITASSHLVLSVLRVPFEDHTWFPFPPKGLYKPKHMCTQVTASTHGWMVEKNKAVGHLHASTASNIWTICQDSCTDFHLVPTVVAGLGTLCQWDDVNR